MAPPVPPRRPGDGIEPSDLSVFYKTFEFLPETTVVHFYKKSDAFGCFSNFFRHETPYEFEMPAEFCGMDLSEHERIVICDFSEKAIMLSKAAIFGDRPSYDAIAQCPDPKDCKRLGQQVNNFEQCHWDKLQKLCARLHAKSFCKNFANLQICVMS